MIMIPSNVIDTVGHVDKRQKRGRERDYASILSRDRNFSSILFVLFLQSIVRTPRGWTRFTCVDPFED